MSEKKLFLLDAYALAYRSYYAFIKNPRYNSKGQNTSAVFGFINTLLDVLKNQKPTHIAVVFDPSGPTFRHEMFTEYKANRESMPEDLRMSIPYIKSFITAMNIPIKEVAGFEADDVIGTLAHMAEKEDFKVYMMTPDKDYAQLVTENVFVFKPARGGNEPELWDPEFVVEKFKVTPDRIIDLLGLMGDSADNVPGCPGVGPKSAEKLISQHGTIEGIYENIDALKGKQKENMINHREQILLSKELVTINTQVDVEFDASDFVVEEPNEEAITQLVDELEFRNLKNRILGKSEPAPKAAVKSNQPVQQSLFDMPVQEVTVAEEELKSIKSEKHDYILADTEKKQKELATELLKYKEVCFDTETTSLTIHSAELVGISFSTEKGKAWYIPVSANNDEAQKTVEIFREFFESDKITKIGQNIKYDISVLKNYNIDVNGQLFDTMIAHYLVQPELRHNLDILAKTYLDYSTITTEELIGKKGKNQKSMRDVDPRLLCDYACEDADITIQLVEPIKAELAKANMVELYDTIEAPLIKVLADMEYQGISLNTDALAEYSKSLQKEIEDIQKSIFAHAEMEFNISSPKQLGEVLFEKLKITDKPKLTKTKQYATGEDVLVKLKDKHPIVNDILEYRGLTKLLSTYVDALPKLVHADTKKIHTSYNQTITSTGRLSSNNPNLQNIPIRDDRGREIRKAFIPTEGNILLAADYSQIELRLMAHFSNDENMITAFNEEQDIHTATAARILGKPESEVSRDDRSLAKGANFGIIYGISSFGLAQNLNISRKESKSLIDSYFENYPNVKTFMDSSIADVRENGYAETFFKRRRYLPDIQSNNAIVRGAAERNAINAPIQGTAADIIKLAMIKVHSRMKAEGLQSKMILQVHDELVFDVIKPELDQLKQIVVEEMEAAAKLKVKLTVECGDGNNWLQAH